MKKYISNNKLLLAVTVLLGAVFSIGATLIAFILRDAIDIAVAKDLDSFISLVIKTAVYIALLGVFNLAYSALSKKFIGKVTYALRKDAFNGIFRKNIQDFKAVNSADYLSALTNDIKLVEDNYLKLLLTSLDNIIVFIASFIVLISLSPVVMLTLFIAVILLIAVPAFFKGALQKKQTAYSEQLSNVTVSAKDFLSGFEVICSYQTQNHTAEAFDDENKNLYKAKYSMDKVVAGVESVSATLGFIVQCSVLFMAAYLIIKGSITAGTLVALVQASGMIVMPIQVLSQNIPQIQGTKPIVERLVAFAHSKNDSFTGKGIPTFNKKIEIQNLNFSYNEKSPVISGINYSFKPGKKYAIIGKSGCGKTTLINLITGYYANYEGNILYDGQEMRQLDIEKIYEMAAIIHQNIYMFDESVEDNISLHKPTKKQDLENALAMSGVKMFLNNSKDLKTPVGENGSKLSGGQRQRIAVARALVQKKPILVLDEGTSAIDMKTAYDIESRLLQQKELTVITITHALNPDLLRGYDKILFMDNGVIVQEGTYDELLALNGSFAEYSHV